FNNYNVISRNYFVNTPAVEAIYPASHTTNGMEAIMIGNGYSTTLKYCLNTSIFENLFENIIGDRHEIVSNKTSCNSFERNSFINNRSGLSIRAGNNVLVK